MVRLTIADSAGPNQSIMIKPGFTPGGHRELALNNVGGACSRTQCPIAQRHPNYYIIPAALAINKLIADSPSPSYSWM